MADITRYEARVARVLGEVGEIRTAVHAMREEGGAFLEEVAAFLDREALLLDRANEADGAIELAWQAYTRERRNYVPTSVRSALLIARAFASNHPGDVGPGWPSLSAALQRQADRRPPAAGPHRSAGRRRPVAAPLALHRTALEQSATLADAGPAERKAHRV
ncbi:hypothetical protein [Nonomuraea sp. NPDC049784]|uniref:hypothetical protein n=1 Tax=Nonomuraea sp. NPDC049784 TaxID=3154361 RepID=UPI0033C37C2C